ncbi:MAG: DUF2807 domain-containing protein [Saprospiraceae bacterium]|nr:DUF2807 domain-containing protein [Saprospiraceae bacterium]
MKRLLNTTLFIFLLALTSSAQDDVRRLSSFSELSVSGGITVDLYEGQPKAEIEMIKGDLDKLVTEVKGDKLKIYFDNGKWGWSNGNNKAKIKLYFRSLDGISASAGCKIEGHSLITADRFDADASSGARMEVNVEASSIDSDVSSGASTYISGEAKRLSVDVSSGGSFVGSDLKANDVDADVSSGGSVKVWATKSLTADASSGGSIKYKGNPDKTNIDAGKYSGGSVRKM